MSLKRSASSSRLTMVSRPSPFNASVTLFAASDASISTEDNIVEAPRRSKRAKRVMEQVTDIEDAVVKHEEITLKALPTSTPKKRRLAAGSSQASQSPSPKKNKLIKMALDVPHPEPVHWRECYDKIREMREKYVAPVDTMGCDRAQLREIDPKSQRLSTLISLMLSSQTKDEVTDAATAKLRQALGGSITVDALISADNNVISEAIAKVGFWRRKTQYIKQAAVRLRDDFDSDVPKTVDELCSLPGVGPKMAFLCLQSAWKINDGIGVDVHVHRITNRLHWHKPPTKAPEETRLNLQSWLPKELHPEINHLLVGFGQTICLPIGPRCDECLLSHGLCPSAQKMKVSKNRKVLQLRTELVVEKVEEKPPI